MGELLQIHRDVDVQAEGLEKRHASRMQCREGCHDCCIDGIRVHAVEAELIRRNHQGLLAEGHPHPPGRCAFLDSRGSCRIYEDRPYVCRTQGLPLRWFGEDPEGAPVEYRDICPLNEEGPPLETLEAGECWLLGPWEQRLADLQRKAGSSPARVALRSLFSGGVRSD